MNGFVNEFSKFVKILIKYIKKLIVIICTVIIKALFFFRVILVVQKCFFDQG